MGRTRVFLPDDLSLTFRAPSPLSQQDTNIVVARKKKRTIKTGKRSLVGASLEVRPRARQSRVSSNRVSKPAGAHTRPSEDEKQGQTPVALRDVDADLPPFALRNR